jgi:hypothetical protein
MSSVLSMSLRGRTQQFHANVALNSLRHKSSETVARAANTKSGPSLSRKKTTQPPQKTPRPVVPKWTGVAINNDPRKIVFRPNNVKHRSSKDPLPSQTFTSNPLSHKTVAKQSYGNGVVNESLSWEKLFPSASNIPQHEVLPDVLWPGDTYVLQLPRGGQICYARGGRRKEHGPVMVLLDGTPGCRLSLGDHKYCEDNCIRMFSFDRPGYGHSTLHEGESMVDHIRDIEW